MKLTFDPTITPEYFPLEIAAPSKSLNTTLLAKNEEFRKIKRWFYLIHIRNMIQMYDATHICLSKADIHKEMQILYYYLEPILEQKKLLEREWFKVDCRCISDSINNLLFSNFIRKTSNSKYIMVDTIQEHKK